MCVCIIKPECLRRLERQLVYIVGTAKSKRRRRALNTAALNTAQHTGPQHSEDRHRTQLNTAALNSEDRHRTQRLSAQLNTAALNSEDRHRPLHTPQHSEDRHRTQRLSAPRNADFRFLDTNSLILIGFGVCCGGTFYASVGEKIHKKMFLLSALTCVHHPRVPFAYLSAAKCWILFS